jgi:hypothetical protein
VEDNVMPSILQMPLSSVYPGMGIAPSLGLQSNVNYAPPTDTGESDSRSASNATPMAPPISTIGWLAAGAGFSVLLILLMLVAHKMGGEEARFGSIKGSIYNVFIISASAFVGLPLLRVAAIKSKIPGLMQWALSV